MGKKEIIAVLLCLLSTGTFSQTEKDSTFVDKGLIRVFGCFSFDYRMHQNAWDYQLHGFGEYYPEKKISFFGETYKYLDSNNELPLISNNLSVAVGMAYHWPVKNLDPYVFFSSGGNFYSSRVELDDGSIVDEDWKGVDSHGNPLLSLGAGFNLFVWKHFNFFVQCRYTHTFIYSKIHIQKMDSFSVSYGIGFNMFTLKKNRK